MSSPMMIRIDEGMKRKVSQLAKTEGKSVSEIVRELLQQYVRERDMQGYFDEVWNRIQGELAASKKRSGDVASTIKKLRREKRKAI